MYRPLPPTSILLATGARFSEMVSMTRASLVKSNSNLIWRLTVPTITRASTSQPGQREEMERGERPNLSSSTAETRSNLSSVLLR